MYVSIFRSLDEKSLKHLIEFIREIAERPNTKQFLQEYDFCAGIQAAIMTLENVTDSHAIHVNSLFEIIKIVTTAKSKCDVILYICPFFC